MTVFTRARVAALLSASVVVLAGCGTGDDPEATDGNDAPTTSAKPGKTPKPTEEPSPSDSGSGSPDLVAVPVYFVGSTPLGPRLFREFRSVEADNPVDEALALLAAGDTLDGDYSTLLPDQVQLTSHDEHIVVSVPDAWAERTSGMSATEARLAVQQVVFTVQGALQQRSVVDFTVDGASTPVLGLGKSDFEAQDAVLAAANVTEPAEGAAVADTFTASGVANSFEATVPWEVRDATGTTVLDGFATAEGWGDKLYPWQSPVDVSSLAPGTYTFVAMTDDPSDGEGKGPTEDSKTITVQ
jgi:immunoglobulin-like protein involved in spore germination/sporulation and spore germination protein